MIKESIVIAYSGGNFGSYVNFIVNKLIAPNSRISNPFTDNGTSHNLSEEVGTFGNMSQWEDYVKSDKHYPIVRIHPKTKNTETVRGSLEQLSKETRKLIYIQPTKQTLLFVLNNQFYKAFDDWWLAFFNSVDSNNIYKGWNITPGEDIPVWIKREFLSLYLMPMWLDLLDWGTNITSKNWLTIHVDDLFFNFRQTVNTIANYLNLDVSCDLMPQHLYNTSLQEYLGTDFLANEIVNCTITRQDFSWNKLSLVTESWIQWELRNQGYEIKCDGLDTFPTTSLDLANLLYKNV